jgi:lipid-A-disaccharide synthase
VNLEHGQGKILLVTGEASGDLHGSNVVKALRQRNPEIQILGVGGEQIRRAGARMVLDSSKLAVVGITEVLGHWGALWKAYGTIKKVIQESGLNLLILIDFPDFNLMLAKVARKAGVPILYYISPQVWAWRSGRVKKIASRVNRMAVIFPFEIPFYEKAGLPVEFVGHPLLDIMESGAREEGSFPDGWRGKPLIALLPGSREKEVKSLLPEMIRGAEIILKKRPATQFLLPAAPTIPAQTLRDMVRSSSLPILVVEGKTHAAIRAADLVLVASGTATLETAVLGKPMVILYRVSPLSYWIGRALIKVEAIGLVNIVAGDKFVPELLQGEAVGEKMAAAALRILEDEPYRRDMLAKLGEVRKKLGTPGAADRVARIALEMIQTYSS